MLDFGDRVRVRATREADEAGVSGRPGTVYGYTTPSLGFVTEIVGTPSDDTAVAVTLDGEDDIRWFATDLIEFVDHGAGTTIQIGEQTLTRESDGSWTKA
jgi:hypothetical protein